MATKSCKTSFMVKFNVNTPTDLITNPVTYHHRSELKPLLGIEQILRWKQRLQMEYVYSETWQHGRRGVPQEDISSQTAPEESLKQ